MIHNLHDLVLWFLCSLCETWDKSQSIKTLTEPPAHQEDEFKIREALLDSHGH